MPNDVLLESASFAVDGDAAKEAVAIAQAATFNTNCRAVIVGRVGDEKLPDLGLSPERDERTFLSIPLLTTNFSDVSVRMMMMAVSVTYPTNLPANRVGAVFRYA